MISLPLRFNPEQPLTFLTGEGQPAHLLRLTKMSALRQLTIHVPWYLEVTTGLNFIIGMLSTITSSTFSKFVLKFGSSLRLFSPEVLGYRNRWQEADIVLGRFAKRGEFKLVVGMSSHFQRTSLQRDIKQMFPLLMLRGCIHFEVTRG